MPKKALGRGFSALLPDGKAGIPTIKEPFLPDPDKSGHAGLTLKLDEILPNPHEPRSDKGNLSELITSIKENGIIEPVVVRKTTEGYQVICGGRRLSACKEAGIEEVPVVLRDADDREMLELAIVENLQRKDLNPIEEAGAYERLNQEFGLSHKKIADRVGKDRVTITNRIRLLSLPDEVKKHLISGVLTEGHGRSLLQIEGEKERIEVAKVIAKKKLTVRQSEKISRKKKNIFYSSMEQELREFFGTEIHITKGRKKGKIEIEFYSDEDLERIVEKLKSLKA